MICARPDGYAGGGSGSAGFTLIELIVALALFALISLAGMTLIETIVGVQQRTDGRSQRLAELQRAVFLITSDFEQLTAGPARDAAVVSLTRGSRSGAYQVSYELENGALHRRVGEGDRVLLTSVGGLQWRFLKGKNWSDVPTTEREPERPRAVELTIELRPGVPGPAGSIRRVLELPGEPDAP